MNYKNYQPNSNFDVFLAQLHQKHPMAWKWLIAAFRKRLLPWLMNKTANYSKQFLSNRKQFVEEVFEACLLKFYELLATGEFKSYNDLEATIVTIAKYKLKEGFARLKREQRIYLIEDEGLMTIQQRQGWEEEQAERQQQEMIYRVQQQLKRLNKEDRQLLQRYFEGEELQDLAKELNISPAACRKRKQRILDKLKKFVLKTIPSLLF